MPEMRAPMTVSVVLPQVSALCEQPSKRRIGPRAQTSFGGVASRAIDDNQDGRYRSNSVTHTNHSQQPWWQVDLGSERSIDNITLWNRTDNCCTSRLSDFHILVSSEPFGDRSLSELLASDSVWSTNISSLQGSSINRSVDQSGRYVRIQLAGTQALSLAEVEIFGN